MIHITTETRFKRPRRLPRDSGSPGTDLGLVLPSGRILEAPERERPRYLQMRNAPCQQSSIENDTNNPPHE